MRFARAGISKRSRQSGFVPSPSISKMSAIFADRFFNAPAFTISATLFDLERKWVDGKASNEWNSRSRG